MKIESFEAACELLKSWTGTDYSKLPVVDGIPSHLQTPVVSQYKLWVIAEASRQGEKLNRGYYPWFWRGKAGSGSGFSCLGYFYAYDHSVVGARLEFPNSESAIHAGEQHLQLYKDVMTIDETIEYNTTKSK